MPANRSERAQAAVAVVGLLSLLVLAAIGGGVAVRASLDRQRLSGTADGAALAAGAVLRDRDADLLPRTDPRTHRRLPPRLHPAELVALARTAASRAARAGGAELVSLRVIDGARGLPAYADVQLRRATGDLPGWLGAGVLAGIGSAGARAGLDYAVPDPEPARFRPVDLSGSAGVDAVIAAASAQLGWPYLWGGESRAEGGFDCSGLIDYALAAAGFGVGRPTAAGLQRLTSQVPLAAVQPGDLVFVGDPAHHVGMVVAPGLAIEAPHTGAVVHYEPLAEGGWTSAGRLAVLVAAGPAGDALPAWVPEEYRHAIIAAGVAESLPPALLAAQLERESGFDPRAVSGAGAQGIAQFEPGTWVGDWNPWRGRSPFEADAAIRAQARLMHSLVDRAGGDLGRALAAYHDGWAGSETRPWPPVTRAYVSSILERFGGSSSLPATADLAAMTAARGSGPVLRLVSREQGPPNE
jgi:cell wall-associated NlpC family hydrolase